MAFGEVVWEGRVSSPSRLSWDTFVKLNVSRTVLSTPKLDVGCLAVGGAELVALYRDAAVAV